MLEKNDVLYMGKDYKHTVKLLQCSVDVDGICMQRGLTFFGQDFSRFEVED